MKNHMIKFGVGILTLSILSVCLQAQDDLKLRKPAAGDGALAWKFTADQVLKMKMTQDVTMTMDIQGQEMEVLNNSVSEMTLTVNSVDADGVATVSNVIDRMVLVTEAPGMSVSIDTASDEEYDAVAAQIADVIEPMIGMAVTQKMAPQGKIFDVEVPDGMLDGAKGNPMMAQMFNEEMIKQTTSKANLVFPEGELAMGDKWENEATMTLGSADVNTSTNYEYLGVADVDGTPLHVIRGVISMSFPDGMQGMDVDIIDEDSTFLFYFDGNKGRLTKSELDQNVSMEIAAGPQTISQEVKQEMTIEVTEGE